MTTKETQVAYTAEVVYGLMTGIYNLKVFGTPYDQYIPNDLTIEEGIAYEAFSTLYASRNNALDLLNALEHMEDRGELPIFEKLLDASDHALADCTQAAFMSGFHIADESKPYIIIRETISAGKELFIQAGDTQKLGLAELDKMKAAIDNMLVLLTGKAFAYGIAFGNGEHPLLWVDA